MYVRHNNIVMTRKLVKNGNSYSLTITKEMKEHLGVRETVSVSYEQGRIVLRRPTSIDDAEARTDAKFSDTYRELAQ